jgi:cyclic pyranopterin phosphate synthase
VRFIEFMDVGTLNAWSLEHVVPADEIRARIDRIAPIVPIDDLSSEGAPASAVAERYRYADGRGEVGIIASVTRPFCATCTRARLSADGRLVTCLFAADGRDLRGLVRGGTSDEGILESLIAVWQTREDRYSESRAASSTDPAGTSATRTARRRLEMYQVGG